MSSFAFGVFGVGLSIRSDSKDDAMSAIGCTGGVCGALCLLCLFDGVVAGVVAGVADGDLHAAGAMLQFDRSL